MESPVRRIVKDGLGGVDRNVLEPVGNWQHTKNDLQKDAYGKQAEEDG
jgi:hypothetical protein